MASPASLAETQKSFAPGPNTGEWPYESESTRSFIDMGDGVTAPPAPIDPIVREFVTGATRDQDTTKFDYEGFLSPLVLTRFAEYMHINRVQRDGTTRDSDNWQKGIPLPSYMKSLWRHLMTVWRHHRNMTDDSDEDLETALCGVIFNAQGYLHELIKARQEVPPDHF